MGKHKRSRKRLIASGANLSDVPLWEIWSASRTAFWWLCCGLWRLVKFNPLTLIARRQRQLYLLDPVKGEGAITPPWTERIGDFFRSDERRKTRLLQWTQDVLPRLGVEDFTASWHDGLALCSLLEDLCPGLCPRPELLRSHHRVNNCRLGLKLAQRYLGLSKMMITAEEMAIADTDVEMKIVHLVQLIKWRHQRGDVTLQSASHKTKTSLPTEPVPAKVMSRGTGLKAGIVGRRAKFNILTDSACLLDLHVAIQGPNNEMNSERITSLHHDPRQDARGTTRSSQGGGGFHQTVAGEEDARTKLIEDNVGNVFLRQKSLDEDLYPNVIPFDYQCVGEGRFLVTYIPRSPGPYFISIKSQDCDIEGSPFEVKVSDWMTSWNVMPKPRVMSFDMLPSIEETPATGMMVSRDALSPRGRLSDRGRDAGSTRSASGRHRMAQVSKQLTIMKKRVLKRVISRNGEEILLTPSPTLSRQSSADISDLSEDDHSGGSSGCGWKTEDRASGQHGHDYRKSPGPTSPRHEARTLGGRGGGGGVGGDDTLCGQGYRKSPGPTSPRHKARALGGGGGGGGGVGGDDRLCGQDEERGGWWSDRDGVTEDFSNNSCNITLSVTSFEDEEEERKARDARASSNQSLPAPPASPVHRARPLPPSTFSTPSPFEDGAPCSTAVNYDRTPGMYPSSPKLRAKVPEAPIHINVRSQLLGPSSASSSLQAGLYTITNNTNNNNSDTQGGNTAGGGGGSRYLSVTHHCASPVSSDDASENCSDVTDLPNSPIRQQDHDDGPTKELRVAQTPVTHDIYHTVFPPRHSPGDHYLTQPTNRRRFEESLTHRDGDADDSGDNCSQLVSALTELKPSPIGHKKAVGRSYSDGAKFIVARGMARGGASVIDRRLWQQRGQNIEGRESDWDTQLAEEAEKSKSEPSSSWNSVGTKVVTSHSLRTTCVYLNDRPFADSRSLSLHSQPSVDSLTSLHSHHADNPSFRPFSPLPSSSSSSISVEEEKGGSEGGANSDRRMIDSGEEKDGAWREDKEEKGGAEGGANDDRRMIDSGSGEERDGAWREDKEEKGGAEGGANDDRRMIDSGSGEERDGAWREDKQEKEGEGQAEMFEEERRENESEITEQEEWRNWRNLIMLREGGGARGEGREVGGGTGATGGGREVGGGTGDHRRSRRMLGNTGRKWKTFDGGSTVEHEGEGGATRWRLSLHGRRSNSFTALRPPLDTAGGYSTQPCPPYSHTDSLQQENSSILDKLNDDDEILEVVIESQARHDSPPDSPGYLPNDSPPDNPGYRLNDSPYDSPGYLPNDSPPDSPEYLHNDSPPDSPGYLHNEDEVLGETHREDSWGSEPETSTGGEKGQLGGREREACDGETRRMSEGQTSDCVREREACDGETRRMSEGQTSDCVSDDYTASSTMKSKFRGNLSRQHRVGNTAKPTTYTITTTSTAGTNTTTATSRHTNTNNKPFTNTPAETTATTSHPATTSATTTATFTSRDSATGGTESHRFRTIHKQKAKSRSSSASVNPPVAIVTPKAKTNKATQVNYPQIKEETGWKPPGVRLHRRKRYVKVIGSYSTSPVTLKPYQSGRKMHPDHVSNDTAVDQASKENRAAYNSKAFKGCLPVNATLNRSPGNSSVSNNTRLLHESRQYGASNNATQSVWHSQREGNAVAQSKQHSVYDDATASRVSNRIVEGVASNGEPYNTDVSPESCRNRKLRLASTEESGDNEQKKQHNHSTALSDQQKKTDCTLKSDANKSARFCRQSSISQAQGHDTQGMQGTRTVSTAPDSEATAHVRHHTTAAKTDTDPALSTPSNPSSDYSGCESTDSSARGDQLNRSSGNRNNWSSHHQRANARLHPYARARSDPQFSRNPDLPCDAVGRVPLAAARGSPLGRPPRPHADHVLAWVERSALGHDDLHEQPERQSTVDTLDSGIENESPIYGSYFVSGHRRLHRQPYPWSIDLDPSLIRASGAADDLFSGHRRLSRRSYPWEMAADHPVTVTPGSPGSGSTTDGGHDEDDLHLTLGNVIEAAVHRSVCKILSGSSSPGSHSSLPSFALQPGDRKRKKGEGGNSDSYRSSEPSLPYHLKGRESRGRSDSKHSDVPSLSWRGEAAGQSAFSRRRSLLSDQAGSDDTGWCSDSELYVKRDDLLLHHGKPFRRRPRGGHTGSTLNRASSDVKEDFFRSVAILADSQASVWLQRPISPDFGESKSDGRYSPYSVTDIPCFELPSGATKIRRHGSRSSSHFPHFPHQHHPPATAPSSHAPLSQSRAHLTKDKPGCSQLHCLQPQGLPHTRPTSHSVSKVQGVRQPVVNPPPSSSSSFSSSSSSKPLVLRRQTGVGGKGVSSPDMLSTPFAMVEPEQRHRHRSEMLLSSSSSSSSSGKHGQSEPVSTPWGATSAKKVTGKSDDGGTVDTNRLPGHATLATDTNILDPSLWIDLEGTMKGQTEHELWLGAVPSEAATFLSHRSNVERSAKPRIIIHPSDVTPQHSELAQTLSTSTEDSSSYCGFGISRTQRTDLLDHLRHFRDLTDMGQKRDFPDDGSAGRGCSISPSSMDGLCLTGSPLGCLSPSSDPFDETSPLSSASLFANNSFFQQDDLGTFDRTDEIGERSALGAGHLSVRGSLASTETANWDSDSASGRETNHVICNSGATLDSDDRLGSDLSSCGTERLDSGSDRLGSDLSSCGTERLDSGRDMLGSDLSSCGRERLDSGRDRLGSDLSSCGTERLDSGRDRLGSDLSSCGRERLDSGSSLGQDLTLSPIQPRVAHASLNGVHLSEACPSAGNDVIEAPDVGRCMAFGAGLSFGQLGVQNNFQVWTEREDSGCVTVAVFGHRSHCVTDTSVTYIGDNLYDVTFSVTSPGYYVIVVKCGEESLPDSPYICTVTN